MKKILFLSLCVFSTLAPAMREYYSLTRSVRALGMGGSFYGLSDDEYALFYNPAGLGFNTRSQGGLNLITVDAAKSTLTAVNALTGSGGSGGQGIDQIINKLNSVQGSPVYANITPPFPYFVTHNFGIGLLIADTKIDLAYMGRDFNSNIDATAIVDTGLVVGYAHEFLDDHLSVGANLKGIFRAGGHVGFNLIDIAKKSSLNLSPSELGGAGGGVDFDLGAIYEIPREWNKYVPHSILSRLALSLNNGIGTDFPWDVNFNSSSGGTAGHPPGLPRMVSLSGYTAFEGWNFIDHVNLVVDFAEFAIGHQPGDDVGSREGSLWKHVNIGAEAPLFSSAWLIPRLGIYRGYPSFGLGIDLRFLKLDFAAYTEELSSTPGRFPSPRYAITIFIGGSGERGLPVMDVTATHEDQAKKAAAEEAERKKRKEEKKKKEEEEKPNEEKPKEETAKPSDQKPSDAPKTDDSSRKPKSETETETPQ